MTQTNKCESCRMEKINLKQGCAVKEYIRKHDRIITLCPCMECLVKVTCHNVCSPRFNYVRKLLVEVEGNLLEQEEKKSGDRK